MVRHRVITRRTKKGNGMTGIMWIKRGPGEGELKASTTLTDRGAIRERERDSNDNQVDMGRGVTGAVDAP